MNILTLIKSAYDQDDLPKHASKIAAGHSVLWRQPFGLGQEPKQDGR